MMGKSRGKGRYRCHRHQSERNRLRASWGWREARRVGTCAGHGGDLDRFVAASLPRVQGQEQAAQAGAPVAVGPGG